MLGGAIAPSYPKFGLDFNSGSVDTFSVYRGINFFITNASICDTSGQLLFYTNGDYIENRNYSRLLNSTNFNPTITGDTTFGEAGSQTVIILPYPDHSYWYYIFHVNGEYFTAHSQSEFQPLELRYSIVDMNLGGGLGGIIAGQKTIPIISDTLTWGRITACKHANGRDWWLIMHRYYSDLYYKLLITPGSISVSSQNIGSIISSDVDGQAVFSADGTKYSMLSDDNKLDIMDFDRCTGDFSNEVTILINDGNLATLGCAFSPGGQFLYVSTNEHVFQFDTWSANVAASKTTVATYDGYVSGLHSTFYMMQLGPDNKIYLSTSEGTDVMHVINNPEQSGMSCDLVQHQLRLPSFNAFGMPNAPNYDLGAMVGSSCDSLISEVQSSLVQNSNVDLFPNPSSGIFSVKLKDENDRIVSANVEDVLGKNILKIEKSNSTFDLSEETAGVYFLKVKTEKQKFFSAKLVKQ